MSPLRAHGAKALALLLVGASFLIARSPGPEASELRDLASRYSFTPLQISAPPGLPTREIRDVHPAYEGIRSWISGVGGAIALTDLESDGLTNDLCYVDTRLDVAIVAPAPTGEERYEAFALDPGDLPYDDTMAPMGCQPVDANADGRMDLLVYHWGRSPILYMSNGDAPAPDAFEPIELLPDGHETWFSNAVVTADIDGDGNLDLLVGNYFPDDAAVLDTSGGGRPTMQHSMSRAANGGANRLLLGTGDSEGPLYTDTSDVLEGWASDGWTLALGAADLTGNMLPEIHVSNDFGPDVLLRNDSTPGSPAFTALEGRRTIDTPRSKVFGTDSFKGMGIDFGDIDGDGELDMAVSNITEEFALHESNFIWVNTGETEAIPDGRAPFRDRSDELGLARSGWGWDIRIADLDNSGHSEVVQAVGFVAGDSNRWPEIQELALVNDELMADPRAWPELPHGTDLSGDGGLRFFAREGGEGAFAEIGDHVGVGRSTVSRGIALADTDGNGILDLALANQWDAPLLYANESPDPGTSISLNLLRPAEHGTTPAIGASVRVTDPNGRTYVAQVDGGNGHSGKSGTEILVGLGRISPDTELTVDLLWRDVEGTVHEETTTMVPGRYDVVLTDGTAITENTGGGRS
ncbi:FG-GAP repeat domain-containing protein [Nocardiopsis alba]|uniref:FG-GAP repeat domain-containing protein n=1 Tax=Nocardiopsis alba TaxID=53437 RepID=UPI00366DE01F